MQVSTWLSAILVGSFLPLQALVNARLGQLGSGALFASLISFAVGTLALLMAWCAWRPAGTTLPTQAPWWVWTGGLVGAAFVATSTVLVSKIGAASLVCLVVFGQLAGSLLLDHFGVLQARQPIDALKLVGIVLVGVGMLLVVKPWQSV